MSLLDDAKRLLNEMDPTIQGMCTFCYGVEDRPGATGARTQHKAGCVYLRRDRILAALEAAERVLNATIGPGEEPTDDNDDEYVFCGLAVGDHEGRSVDDCPWQALVVALKEPT